MGFHRSLSDGKSPRVSRTLLGILTDLSNVWKVSTSPLISKTFSLFITLLGIVPSAPITIGITVTVMFHCIFCSLARSGYLSLFWPSFNFTLRFAGTAMSTIRQVFFLCFCWLSLGFGGARGVVVIVVGNGHGDTSSNPGRDWLHFT